jgi:hypothetical protein
MRQAGRPGRATPLPPPTIAAVVAVWCGSWNGGRVISGSSLGSADATECTAVTSSAASRSSAGSSPGIRSASMVLPLPGGPSSSAWCPPAAATSTAVRPNDCRRRRACRAPARAALPAAGDGLVVGLPRQQRHQVAQAADTPCLRAGQEPGLGEVLQRHDHPVDAGPGGRQHRGQDPRHRAHPPVEPQLTEQHAVQQRVGRQAARRRQHGRGEGQIEAAAPLGHRRGDRARVIRRCGHGWPLLTTAARTRSRASASAASGRPMTVRPGRPWARSASTSTT